MDKSRYYRLCYPGGVSKEKEEEEEEDPSPIAAPGLAVSTQTAICK